MKTLPKLYFVLFICMTIFSQNSFANTISNDDIYSYFDLSGTKTALNGIPEQMAAMGQQMQLTAKNPDESRRVMEVLASSWQVDNMEEIVFDHIQTNLTNKEMQSLLVWLKSDLSRRIKQAEEKSSEPNFNQEFMQYMAKIQTNPPSADRIQAVRGFIESTQMVEHTIDMVIGIAKGITKNVPVTGTEALTDEQVDNQMQQMEAMMKPQLEQQLILVSYFLYEDLTNDDINRYADFYKKPLGQKELTVISGAVVKALGNWSAAAFNTLNNELSE
ncbi:MAG: hypothetical protein P8I03_13565 [Thalassotalea sp.]|nr:hypothetical protein [Thalassotalea sp.]